MAEIFAQQPGAAELANGMGSELYSRRSSVKAPAPNPEFSFPRLPQNDDDATSDAVRRPRIRPQNLAILPAPSPEFSPGSPEKSESLASASPGRSRPLSSKGMGHRREGSQFIGGDTSSTGQGPRSSSPTKKPDSLPSPSTSVGRRRGHAHRRSGAMSTNDFSAFLNSSAATAPPIPVPGSAPATPVLSSHATTSVPHLERAQSQPSMTTQEKIDFANAIGAREDQEMASTPRSLTSRPRVGFSEKLEFIPRPLSTISSNTTSTMSTVQAMHSANGSISSVLDQRPPTPVSVPVEGDSSRPTSADSGEQPFFGAMEEPESAFSQRPVSASGKALFAKRRRSPPPSIENPGDVSPGSGGEQFYFASETQSEQTSPALTSLTSPSSGEFDVSSGKREGRGRSLASRLLKRARHKSREDSAEGDATPGAAPKNVPAGLMSLDDVNFDEDTSLVIHSAGYKEPVPAAFQPSPSPIRQTFDKDDSAALDLDMAYNAVQIDEDSPGSFANIMKGAVRQHRRTESAPSLSPVQRQSFAPGKQPGSPLKMADVFEEEEEEESPPRVQRPKAQSFTQPKRQVDLQGLGVQIVDAEAGEGVQPRRKSRSPSSKAESTTMDTIPDSEQVDKPPVADLVAISQSISADPRVSMATKSSDEETITPASPDSERFARGAAAAARPVPQPSSSHPLDFAPPPSLAPHAHHGSDISTTSSVPSPDPTNLSFDAPRIGTAASSITDRTTWSSNNAPPSGCPDTGRSTEDVPSLTSSASTMLSGHPSHVSHHSMAAMTSGPGNGAGYHAHTFSGMPSPAFGSARPQSTSTDRAFSFGGIAPRPTRRNWGSRPSTANGSKRASLASLSRLMSKGTDSERSKLSIAWGAQDVEDNAKKEKESKGKRLSRALKFWKSKEKLRESAVDTK